MCSTQGHQEKSITYDYVVHRDIEALDDIVSIDKITKGVTSIIFGNALNYNTTEV
jgi:hypothetical protein